MKTLVLPYGETGWRERLRLLEEVLSRPQVPPFLYGDVLILVPSARMRRGYGRLFLDLAEKRLGVRSLSPPEVQTVTQFLQRLAGSSLNVRLIDETARIVLLEGLVKEHIARGRPSIGLSDLLAPSLAAAAADMIEDLSAGGVQPDRLRATAADADLADRPQVRLLIDVYERYTQALQEGGLADPARIYQMLGEQWHPAWLGHYAAVIIDGIHDAAPATARVLRHVSEMEQCTLLVDAPSPDAIQKAGTRHPLRLLREFLADIGAPKLEAVEEPDAADSFTAGALFSDLSFEEASRGAPPATASGKDLQLCSAVNVRDEVSFIAASIKESLRRGTPPDAILVAFPSLDEYGPLVEEVFIDYGIPYNRALGRQLSTSPVATALIALLSACQEDFSGPALQRIVSSPFLKFAEHPFLAPLLDRFLRDHGVVGGRDRVLSALRRRPSGEAAGDPLSVSLEELFVALAPFLSQAADPLTVWMDRLTTLVAWSGLQTRVSLIKGPLNTNLQAFRKLMDTLTSLRAAGSLSPAYRYTFSEWCFLLRKMLMHARFQVPPDDEGGVQVLGLEESAGHAWKEIYLGGLVDGKFPQRLPQNIFLPEATLETLGVQTLERARLTASFHFYRLLQSAAKVILTRPENEGDRPVVPSPFLEELAPLRIAGMLKERERIQFSFEIRDCRSVPELAKALAVAGEAKDIDALVDLDLPGMEAVRAARGYCPPESRTFPVPETTRVFSVTELDSYLHCPYDYYVKTVLKVEPLESPSEDISALERGSKVHSILRRFYLAWGKPVTVDSRGGAMALLLRLAEDAFGADADTFRNRREKEAFVTVMAERFLDAEITYWRQGMRPAYLEQKIEGFILSLSDGTSVELHAKIDRIDVTQDGDFVIVDYKTGKYPQPRTGADQEIFQLPVYAVMARSIAGQGLALRHPVGLAYYDLAGRIGRLTRDVVLYDRDALGNQPATKPQSSAKSADEFEQILAASMDKARKAIEGILRGEFPAEPKDENQCRFCANDIMCQSEP